MPGFDGTGPMGKGTFTGRGRGYCISQVDSEEIGNKNNQEKEVFDMPRGDGTGPMGLGPMTGRAMGYCTGYNAPGYINPIPGRGYFGWGRGSYGRGGGRGWRMASMGMSAFSGVYPYAPELAPKQEADILKNEADILKKQLEDIQNRIETLGKVQTEKSE